MMRLVFALLLLLGLGLAPAIADTAPAPKSQVVIDKRKLLVQPKNPDGSLMVTPFLEDPVLWARDQQQVFYGAMSGAIRNVRTERPLAALWSLMFLSFGYGIFHAAGPGHGKAVISSWLLATESQLRRGVLIAFMSSIVQALTAIAIVSVLLIAVVSAGAAARDVAGYLESASYGLIAAMGLYLMWTGYRAMPRAPVAPAQQNRRYTDAAVTFSLVTPRPGHVRDLEPGHVHGPDCGCGHAHVPEARDVAGDFSVARAFSLALAVGLRPCSGALLVLLFANTLGLYWAGVASTFAMALGTFITVSAIAALAVYGNALAMRVAAVRSRWPERLAVVLRLAGGLAIAGLGAVLFAASLSSPGLAM
jgi:nickel/cobalt exporter